MWGNHGNWMESMGGFMEVIILRHRRGMITIQCPKQPERNC